METEPIQVDKALSTLDAALRLQFRSLIQAVLLAGGLRGLEHHALGETAWGWAAAELEDARLLVEKIVALGGTPATRPERLEWADDADDALRLVAENEADAVEALRAVIPHTGTQGVSEALEHVLEHVIMRKQRQIDTLRRALG